MHVRKLIVVTLIILTFTSTFSVAKSEDDTSLWNLQRTLASKKYVDLTHAFAPGIPRWPGFPNETRKTIYWYDKRPDTLGAVFFRSYSRMSGSGARMLIHQRISLKDSAQWTKLT